ncbi:sensor histidine kinase [Pseudochryseolinea flava]|uniref:sensor histidine kinase n=1 Tax=Pseudochryseolinea flava TaxID=2059302 RepID=UPI0014022152|nr:two-component regulator propeller domain-containing protein [Pseudochryseolinea flava]
MKIATPLCIIWLLLCGHLSFAQSLNFKNYTGEDVLPSSNVYAAFQDSKGFMWFGTDQGVSRYDGYAFSNYAVSDGLPDKEVFDFFEDTQGRVWFLTMNGKVGYYRDGNFVNASIDSTLRPLDSKSYISMMGEDKKGNIWISTVKDGLICYRRDGKINRLFQDNDFGNIHGLYFKQKDHNMYLLTQRGVYSLAVNDDCDSVVANVFHDVGKKIEDHRKFQINDWYPKFLPVSEDEIIYKDYFKLYRTDLSKNTFSIPYTVGSSKSIYSLAQDGGNVWIGTSHGALLYDRVENKVLRQVLNKSMITDVMKDVEGNYWFTTYGDGIYFCTSLEMFCYTSENGLVADKVTCLAKDSANRIWVGYGRGKEDYVGGAISYIEKNKVVRVTLSDKAYFNKLTTRSIEFNEGNHWVATTQGVFKLQGARRDALITFGRGVAQYGDDLWYGTGEYISRIPMSRFYSQSVDVHKTYLDTDKPIWFKDTVSYRRLGKLKNFYKDKQQRLWISTDLELLRYYRDTVKVLSDDERWRLTVAVNDIQILLNGTVVLATNGEGIVFLKNDNIVGSIREDQGLSSNICNAICVDSDGILWVATNNGLNKIKGYPDSTAVDYMNVYDGILSNQVSDVLVSGDTVWVATSKGLNFFNKHWIDKKKMSPRVYIESLTVRGVPVQRSSQDLVFEYRENDVSIKYTGLLFNNGEPLIFRYKLHDSDPWRFTKSTSVYLPELPPDDYEFIVSARGRSGHWSRAATINFEITRPFWQSAWFIAAIIIGVIAVISLAVYWSFKQQKKEIQRQHRVTISELRSLRAQMNPHFLFNALNSIQGVLLKQSVEVTQDYLGKFGKLMRTILDHADKSSISIKEELDSITNYLEIEQLRANQFQYHIEIDPSLDIYNREIPAMIIQPFVENAIWHGFAHKTDDNQLTIKFTNGLDDETFIEIIDNGIGRKKAQSLRSSKHKSKGIQLVRERIEILNYKAQHKISLAFIDLEDADGNHPGTKVVISIPS